MVWRVGLRPTSCAIVMAGGGWPNGATMPSAWPAGRHGYGSRCASSSSGTARSLNCRSEKSEIESALFVTLRDLSSLRVDLVFDDITSTYSEGKGPRAHGPAPIRTFPQRCDDSLLRPSHVSPRRVCARQACRPCWRRLRAHAI